MMQKANELAKEIIRVELNIGQAVTEEPLAFDVLYVEEEGWVVQTSYCQMGGCLADFIPVKDKDSGIF